MRTGRALVDGPYGNSVVREHRIRKDHEREEEKMLVSDLVSLFCSRDSAVHP
jgi:hypothetical protein